MKPGMIVHTGPTFHLEQNHENGAIDMNINLNEAMEEYARLPFTPYGAYYVEHPPGHIQKEYTMAVSSFIFALSGEAVVYLDKESFAYGTGRVIHCAPGKRFNATNSQEKPAALFELSYHHDGANADYMHCPYELEIGVNPRLFSTLRQLVELRDRPNAQATLQVKTLVYSVLSEMFSSAQSIRQTDAHSVAADAKVYVEQHYMESHSLCELGGRYGMSGKYFSDVFKRHTGVSPIDYLIACRLEQARRLLEATECNVKEIGKSVGYEDAHYFRRQFKRKFGASPSEWREHIFQVKQTGNNPPKFQEICPSKADYGLLY